ncbi:nitrite reductase (NAD(P)H) small subunit [Cryobacterium sp. LW097]|uniref:nitrite reductase small subunit NirD n=1 Tax=unclassified Cryobacterium TaxID=2649013 RepID=UPI000B4DCBED|nr:MULTISPECIES: nitrite reductase small subunit NirD [unclassified Cryobacterium]ASD21598.1 nitrite reductase (NAD(P)H) small subunit [Cryobacterium sp. LW097]TFC84961.1 nitrite reductase small subunit NirD [Cryobacterium sp. TMT4-31]
MHTTPTHPHDSAGHDSAGSADWTSVCDLDRLEPLWAEAALIDGVQVALVLLPDGHLFAVSNQDPATGSCVMSRGIVGSRGDRPTLASPLHKQVYDLETGECFTSADYALPTFPVRVDHGTVQIQVPGSAHGRAGERAETELSDTVEFAAA